MNFLMHILKKLNIVPVPLADIQPQICRARALMEANKLGVFTALEESLNGLTHEEVAERVGISREGAAVLLTALDKTGYLRKREGCYTNGPWAKRWIVNPKRGIANVLKLQIHGWSRLGDLESPLRTGRPIKDYHALEVSTHSERQEIYTLAMREMARILLPGFIKRIKLPKGARRLLDIGGGSWRLLPCSDSQISRFKGYNS